MRFTHKVSLILRTELLNLSELNHSNEGTDFLMLIKVEGHSYQNVASWELALNIKNMPKPDLKNQVTLL